MWLQGVGLSEFCGEGPVGPGSHHPRGQRHGVIQVGRFCALSWVTEEAGVASDALGQARRWDQLEGHDL